MSASTVNQDVPGSLPGQADLGGLRRMTGLAGLATLLLVFISTKDDFGSCDNMLTFRMFTNNPVQNIPLFFR